MQTDAAVSVLLIVPPFYAYGHPCLGTAVLKSALSQRGISSAVLYANALYARQIGVDFYRDIMAVVSPEEMYQEQIFARAAHGSAMQQLQTAAPSDAFYGRYNELYAHKRKTLTDSEMARAEAAIDGFLASVVDEVRRRRPAIVGLSSLYSQINASLAIARAVKRAFPHMTLALGGSNCYGEMGEALSQLPHFDYVFDGEGDLAFPNFCEMVLSGAPLPAERLVHCEPDTSLDTHDIPDYDDFIEQFSAEDRKDTLLYTESSRGCWWGMKNRCRFCGISYQTMDFRAMSPGRAAAQLSDMRKRYPEYRRYYACDSVLPNSYFDAFLERLDEDGFDGNVFYQVKPMLDIDELRKLKKRGIDCLGPGIESLSTRHLKMMKKGTSAATNIALLRNCKEVGIEAKWNHLVALPNDQAADYDEIATRLPLLQHLDPPIITPIYLQRFSPYFDQPGEHGISNVRPMAGYYKSFPAHLDLTKLAYNFDGDVRSAVRDRPEILALFMREIRHWYGRAGSSPAELSVRKDGTRLMIKDTRDCAVASLVEISEADLDSLRMSLDFLPKWRANAGMSRLVDRGLVAEIDNGFLTLVCGIYGLERGARSTCGNDASGQDHSVLQLDRS